MKLGEADMIPAMGTSVERSSNITLMGWGLGTSLWIASCFIVPSVMVLNSSQSMDGTLLMLVLALVLYSGTRLSFLIGGRNTFPLAGTFWLFVYVSMGIAPLAQLVTGLNQILMTREYQVAASLLVLACLVAYDVGMWASKVRPAKFAEKQRKPERVLRRGRLVLLSLGALAATAYTINRAGSVGVFFSSRQERGELSSSLSEGGGQAASALFSAIGTVPQLLVFLCWTALLIDKNNRKYLNIWVWWLLFAAINVVVNNPISNSRYWFLTVAISFLFVLPTLTVFRYRVALTLGTLAALVIFPLSDIFRRETAVVSVDPSRSVVEIIATKDYDQMVMINNGFWWVAREGHTWGYQMLGNLFFWVPRSVWPSKPYDTGVEIGSAMGVGNVNLSSPLWIELWVDFSWVGAIFAFALIGVLSRRADLRFAESLVHPNMSVTAFRILIPLLAGYQFILLRGPLLQSMGRLAVMLAIVLYLFPKAKKAVASKPKLTGAYRNFKPLVQEPS